MAASDYYHKVGRSTATTLSSPGYTIGATSINVASTTNYPTDTGVTVSIDEVDGAGERIAGTLNIFRGDVSSATQINELVYVGGDANRNYSASATTRVYITVSSFQVNRLIDGLLIHSDLDGTLKAGAVDVATVLASDVVTTAKILNANVTTAKLADASVTNAKLATTTGEPGGAWETWTPTLTNLSGGTITYAKYKVIGKTVHFRFKYTLAGAGVTGAVALTLPVTASSEYTNLTSYSCESGLLDATGFLWGGMSYFETTTRISLGVHNALANYQPLSSTVPFTWAASDVITLSGTYEAA